MCLPDGEAVQWCEVTKPGLVGMLFGLPTLGSFGRVLRVKSFWLVCRNLDGLYLGFLHVVFLTGVGSVGNTAINLGYVLGKWEPSHPRGACIVRLYLQLLWPRSVVGHLHWASSTSYLLGEVPSSVVTS